MNSGSIELTAKSRYAFLHQQQIVVDSGARLLLDVQLDARGRAAQDDAQLARRRRLAALQGLLQQTKERVRMRLRYVIDIAFPEAKLAVEIDGWAWHMAVDRFRADRHKGNALVRARWDLLRFTWHDLDGRPESVFAEIRDTLTTA